MSLFFFRLFKWVVKSPSSPHPTQERGHAPTAPIPCPCSPPLAEGAAQASHPSPAAARGRLSAAVGPGCIYIPPRPRPGWGGRGFGRVQRLGQAGGLEQAPRPHWLAARVRPEPGTRVRIHRLPPLPCPPPTPAALASLPLLGFPLPPQHRRPRGWEGPLSDRGRSERGGRGGCNFTTPHLR